MKELGLNKPVLASESSGNNASLETCASDMTNLYFSNPSVDHDGYKSFEDSFVIEYGRKPQFPSAVTAYDAVKVIAFGLTKTNGIGGEELRVKLAKIKNFNGASQPVITFKENGFVTTPEGTFQMTTVKDGKYVKVE